MLAQSDNKIQIEVFGLLADLKYQIARCCAEDLYEKDASTFSVPAINGMLEFQWKEFLNTQKRKLKNETWVFKDHSMIFCNGQLIGGPEEFIAWAETHHNYELFRPMTLYQTLAKQQYASHMNQQGRVHCYLSISIDNEPAGELVIELYSDKVPKTCENFRALCTGEKGTSEQTDYPLNYQSSLLHRIVPKGWVQGGDLWPPHKGNGGESIYGSVFEDESFVIPHNARGVVGMASKGRHTNGSQFYICLQPTPWMDTKYVAFGQIVEGTETLEKIEQVQTFNERPMKDIKITECGVHEYVF
ncbi:PPIL6 [Bugula neritina]|uniref:Peptidyl-prolyl cis-trans isomerase n=1 Tax=Bugula neritina TaxID=10212 RepID=A0A7J7JDU3_BUGNE|nr:PPIL6 [Bugula neritina]